ncbi:MAG: hypothetical protein M3Y87_23935 [Myxococcota bacterium]|nr:hypothetical protein [Myxococcota bacterium]
MTRSLAALAASDIPLPVGDRAEHAASEALAQALAQRHALHLPGARARHRELLERALALTDEVLARAVQDDVDPSTLAAARLTRVRAHAARAEDARHGAGQLSQSAQRAPTAEECEQGWGRIEEIVSGAEVSARDAIALASLLGDPRASQAAREAAAAAQDARRIVRQRNRAYTFHTDPKFSFGEGWYVAAAGVLANIEIQIEPGQPQTAAAERFLGDAGLRGRLVPYRSRPCANKALPAMIARAFVDSPEDAQARLRTAFLGAGCIPAAIAAWADVVLADTPRTARKVLVWVRHGAHHPGRNSTRDELEALCRLASQRGLRPILIGDAVDAPIDGVLDMTLFWRLPLFQSVDMRRAQLQLFEHLRRAHGVAFQVGVTTAGMDGPALMGLPTLYLTDAPNPRLGRWVGAIPGYQEVIRDRGLLERIGQTLSA